MDQNKRHPLDDADTISKLENRRNRGVALLQERSGSFAAAVARGGNAQLELWRKDRGLAWRFEENIPVGSLTFVMFPSMQERPEGGIDVMFVGAQRSGLYYCWHTFKQQNGRWRSPVKLDDETGINEDAPRELGRMRRWGTTGAITCEADFIDNVGHLSVRIYNYNGREGIDRWYRDQYVNRDEHRSIANCPTALKNSRTGKLEVFYETSWGLGRSRLIHRWCDPSTTDWHESALSVDNISFTSIIQNRTVSRKPFDVSAADGSDLYHIRIYDVHSNEWDRWKVRDNFFGHPGYSAIIQDNEGILRIAAQNQDGALEYFWRDEFAGQWHVGWRE